MIDWEACLKWELEEGRKALQAFKESHAGKVFCIYEFSDDTSLGSAMEHGNVFKRVENMRLSKH